MSSRPEDLLHPNDLRWFQSAAKLGYWILVRGVNAASKKYMSAPASAGHRYASKQLDCKAKTADFNVDAPGIGRKETAGLVVNPMLPGYEAAFKPNRLASAKKCWIDTLSHVCTDGRSGVFYMPTGQPYRVQMDENHKHYGCLAHCKGGLSTAMYYIYGDYDLYDIVSAKAPARNERVMEKRYGDVDHARSPELYSVQTFLNANIGRPMVRHGGDMQFRGHQEEDIVVFHPNGDATVCHWQKGRPLEDQAIYKLYSEAFEGRESFALGGPSQQTGQGLWEIPG